MNEDDNMMFWLGMFLGFVIAAVPLVMVAYAISDSWRRQCVIQGAAEYVTTDGISKWRWKDERK